ncbi:hypothetical protein [uncultured Phenylobacterium sp.]|uniref:hypothetical protein n=1 Tax=uncultured Phenylobacterium sp. TaxID=349273 RepID=UPI0025F87FDA|nr:hypothetical protein [uncultured Phenylobacterium sp.]
MSMHAGRYYDVRPRWPHWTWSAYAPDMIRPIGRGEAPTRAAAELAARSCIATHRRADSAR